MKISKINAEILGDGTSEKILIKVSSESDVVGEFVSGETECEELEPSQEGYPQIRILKQYITLKFETRVNNE